MALRNLVLGTALAVALIGGIIAYNHLKPVEKNGHPPLAGYDWLWHSLVARSESTGLKRSFFIEYFVVNPELSPEKVILPCRAAHDCKERPSYAMMLAGAWATDEDDSQSVVLREFFPAASFQAHPLKADVTLGTPTNKVTEAQLQGSVSVSPEEALRQSEYRTTAGSMSWNLQAQKLTTMDAGVATGRISRLFKGLFTMFWHVQGMRTKYSGEIVLNGERFIVDDTVPVGYQDKNWGTGYTNPWIWLSCNELRYANNTVATEAGFLVGGGQPEVLGMSLGKRAIVAVNWKGTLHEFNFAKPWLWTEVKWDGEVEKDEVEWEVKATSPSMEVKAKIAEKQKKMIWVRYDEPVGGKIPHQKLWNGGSGYGTVEIKDKITGEVTELRASHCGCEYGKY